MKTANRKEQAKALRLLADAHSIPNSYYQLAKDRYKSLEKWLRRDGGPLASYNPEVYPQGSFRYGTVKSAKQVFDLDLVVELTKLSKHKRSQAWLKELVGREIKAYAKEHGMKHAPTESRRCWKLSYAEHGGVEFHADMLASASEDESVKEALALVVEPPELARHAIVFTDKKDPLHEFISPRWPMSNPEGFAKWFLEQARPAARAMLRKQVDILPANQWNTPLQVVIRLLKHHRDISFEHDPDHKPVSIVITTLAAHAYDDQLDLLEAFEGIVTGMANYIVGGKVLNPSNPGEDFTDKWAETPALSEAFYDWLDQLQRDVARLGEDLTVDNRQALLKDRFGASVERELFGHPPIVPTVAAAPSKKRPEPWGRRGA